MMDSLDTDPGSKDSVGHFSFISFSHFVNLPIINAFFQMYINCVIATLYMMIIYKELVVV